jgi:hypothetical protein
MCKTWLAYQLHLDFFISAIGKKTFQKHHKTEAVALFDIWKVLDKARNEGVGQLKYL